MASTLCKFCQDLSIERVLGIIRHNEEEGRKWRETHDTWEQNPSPYPDYRHQPSLAALRQSAKDGCSFCKFMMDCFHSNRSQHCSGDESVCVELDSRSTSEDIDGICVIRGLYFRFSTLGLSKLELFVPSGHTITIDSKFQVGRQRLDPNLASASTFSIAKRWLNECRHNHPVCLGKAIPTLPTRVVDVGTSESPAAPRIFITNGLEASYVALSHCWGGDIATTLNADTLVPFQECLPYAELPRNFQDAITVTRELGIRYLWIDSLCILQDSRQDWATESARMGLVYQSATITLSAMIPPNSQSGILSVKKSRRPSSMPSHQIRVYESETLSDVKVTAELVPYEIEGEHKLESMDKLWGQSPLTSRGWTLQEFILSPRILFYGQDQIYWSCPRGFKQADGSPYDSIPIQFQAVSQAILRNRGLSTISSAPDRKEVLSDYYSVVEEYSMRALTKYSDKLPALAGIAWNLHHILSSQYLAGIWACDVLTGLLWRRSTYIRASYDSYMDRRDSSAPSWSWAAAVGQLHFPYRDLPTTPWQARLVDWDIVPIDSASPFGQVRSGRIVLEGFMIPIFQAPPNANSNSLVLAASVELNPYTDELLSLYHAPLATFRPAPEGDEDSFDAQTIDGIIERSWNAGKALPPEIEKIFSGRWVVNSLKFKEQGLCILLLHAEVPDHGPWVKSNMVGLMLRPVPSEAGSGVYERVGYAQTARFLPKWLEILKRQVVTLV